MIYLSLVCRVALAAIFAVACLSKLQSRASYLAFRHSLGDLGLPWPAVLPALGLAIPAAEGVITALLIASRASQWGLFASVLLLGSFTAGLAIARSRGRVVRCQCFGGSMTSAAEAGPAHIARNSVLLVGALAGALATLASPARASTPLLVFAIGLGLIAAGLFLHWEELAFALRPAPDVGYSASGSEKAFFQVDNGSTTYDRHLVRADRIAGNSDWGQPPADLRTDQAGR